MNLLLEVGKRVRDQNLSGIFLGKFQMAKACTSDAGRIDTVLRRRQTIS